MLPRCNCETDGNLYDKITYAIHCSLTNLIFIQLQRVEIDTTDNTIRLILVVCVAKYLQQWMKNVEKCLRRRFFRFFAIRKNRFSSKISRLFYCLNNLFCVCLCGQNDVETWNPDWISLCECQHLFASQFFVFIYIEKW